MASTSSLPTARVLPARPWPRRFAGLNPRPVCFGGNLRGVSIRAGGPVSRSTRTEPADQLTYSYKDFPLARRRR